VRRCARLARDQLALFPSGRATSRTTDRVNLFQTERFLHGSRDTARAACEGLVNFEQRAIVNRSAFPSRVASSHVKISRVHRGLTRDADLLTLWREGGEGV
jgi:hypothetical protein